MIRRCFLFQYQSTHRAEPYALPAFDAFFHVNRRRPVALLGKRTDRTYSDGRTGMILGASAFFYLQDHILFIFFL